MAANLIEIPRGPIYRERSGTGDYTDQYSRRLLEWRDSAVAQGIFELQQNPEYDNIDGYIDLIQGDNRPSLADAWRTKFQDNRIARARVETLAYLTDIRPTIDVTTHIEEYRKTAEVLKGVIQHEWVSRRMDQSLEKVIDHALFGTGFWKIGCSWPGAFHIVACGVDTVIPIQQGDELQDSVAVLYRSFKAPNYFRLRWPSRSDGIEKEADPGGMVGVQSNQYTRPWNINEYSWNSMSPSMRYHKSHTSPQAAGNDRQDFPLIQLQEFWIEDWHTNESGDDVIVKDPFRELDEHNYWYRVAPGQRLYPRKRLVVFAGDRVMYDGPSPYWHGLFPFAKLRLDPVVWSSGGLSKYRSLKPLNESINRIGSGIEHVVEKAINPTIITKDGAVNSTSWEKFFAGKPGGKLRVTPIANPTTDVRFVDPPVLPGYVEQHRQYLLSAFREHAGSLDVSSMQKKKQLPGGDTIEQFKDSMTTAHRRELRNLEIFLEDAGRIAVPCIPQYFSRDQRLRILGSNGLTMQDFDFRPGDMASWASQPDELHRNFALEIVSGSMHSGARDREKAMAAQLFSMGALPIEELYRRLEIGNAQELIAKLAQERQTGMIGKVGKSPKATRGQRNGKVV